MGKGFEEHEFRHQLAKGVVIPYGFIHGMNAAVVIVKIRSQSLVIQVVFNIHHAAQVADIVGVAHCHPVFRIGKIT